MAKVTVSTHDMELLSIHSKRGCQKHFYQWDSDRMLTVSGDEKTAEVHFIVPETNEVLTSPVYLKNNKAVCDVPNILLQNTEPFTAYLYIDDDYGKRTIYQREFEIEGRPKPSDYIYDEEEIRDYEKLENQVKGIAGIVDALEQRAEHLIADDGITLQDRETGKAYILYVSNGKVMLKESSIEGGEE